MSIFMDRNILTIVLCWCLVITQFALPNRAYAQGSGSGGADPNECANRLFDQETDRANSDGSYGSGSSANQDQFEDGVSRGNVIDLEDQSGCEATGSGVSAAYHTLEFATLIIAIAATVAGTTFVLSCVNQPSAWVFGLTSLAWLIAEIIQTAQTKDAADRRLSIITNVSEEDMEKQVTAINVAKEQTQQAADHAGTRYTLTVIAAVLYVIAAVVALIEGILHVIPTVNYNDQCSGASAMNAPPGMQANPLSVAGAKKFFEKLLPLLGISDAQADGGDDAMLGMGIVGLLLTIFMAILSGVRGAFSSGASTNGFARAIIMGVFAGFVIAAAVLIKKKKDQLEDRVKKYNELLAKLKKATDAPDAKDLTKSKHKSPGGGDVGDTDIDSTALNENPLAGNCANGEQNKLPIKVDMGCKGKPMVIEGLTSLPVNSIIETPDGLLDGMKNSKDFAKNMAGGKGIGANLRKYDSAAYAKFNKMKHGFGKKYQDLLKTHKGEEVASLRNAERDFRKSLMAKVKTELNKYSPEQLNSMMGQLLGFDAPDLKEKADLTKDEPIFNKKSDKGAAGARANAIGTIKLDGDGNNEINTNTVEEVDSADALQGLKFKENDIAKDTGASLFLIITNRYRKTAYPLIFDKDPNGPVQGKQP